MVEMNEQMVNVPNPYLCPWHNGAEFSLVNYSINATFSPVSGSVGAVGLCLGPVLKLQKMVHIHEDFPLDVKHAVNVEQMLCTFTHLKKYSSQLVS